MTENSIRKFSTEISIENLIGKSIYQKFHGKVFGIKFVRNFLTEIFIRISDEDFSLKKIFDGKVFVGNVENKY